VALFALLSIRSNGGEPIEPKSKLDSIDQPGVVIIRGSIDVGTISLPREGLINISCREALIPSQSKHERGIAVEIHQGSQPLKFLSISVIDYDEIDSFLKGFDQVRKLGPGSSKLGEFMATYSTRDRLTISATEKKGGTVEVALTSSGRSLAGVELSPEHQESFRSMIVKAKAKIDSSNAGK
jgi:hypothetical protein